MFKYLIVFYFPFPVSAVYVSSGGGDTGRQRHAPLYGRFVDEEELPATHRDVMHHVSFKFFLLLAVIFINFYCLFFNPESSRKYSVDLDKSLHRPSQYNS